MSDESPLDRLINHYSDANLDGIRFELRTLRRESEWARAQLPVREGDRVRIVVDVPAGPPRAPGWYAYREALHVGALATVRRVALGGRDEPRWYADVVLDRQWSVTEPLGGGVKRYWHGPSAETPDGYEMPSSYDQEHYPEGRRGVFSLRLEWLARVESQAGQGEAAA